MYVHVSYFMNSPIYLLGCVMLWLRCFSCFIYCIVLIFCGSYILQILNCSRNYLSENFEVSEHAKDGSSSVLLRMWIKAIQRRTYLIHKEQSRKRYTCLQYLQKLQLYSHQLPAQRQSWEHTMYLNMRRPR